MGFETPVVPNAEQVPEENAKKNQEEAVNAAADEAGTEVKEETPEVSTEEVRETFEQPPGGQMARESEPTPEGESRVLEDGQNLSEVRKGLEAAGLDFFVGVRGREAAQGGRVTEAQEEKYKMCERCKGKGKVWFFFKCGVCGGTGRVVAARRIERTA